jgi:hypothetical protein
MGASECRTTYMHMQQTSQQANQNGHKCSICTLHHGNSVATPYLAGISRLFVSF